MELQTTKLEGILLLTPRVFDDVRGFFYEAYNRRTYHGLGIDVDFVQDNHSRSVLGTVRGLHYQLSPGQAKLVRAIHGQIRDVVVDIRVGSPTYGLSDAFILSAENRQLLFVPAGFAHGFSVLSDAAEVEYKVDSYYDPGRERGIRWDDPALAIDWSVDKPVLSAKDAELPLLRDAENDFVYDVAAE